MFSKMMIASGAVALVAAVPMAKRDLVWVTETDVNVVTVPITTTIFVEPTAAAHYGHNHGGHNSKSTITSHVQSTVTVTSAVQSSVSSSTAEAQSTSEAVSVASVAPVTTSTSVYVAPTTSTSVYVAPTTSTSVYVAPTTSTSVWVAPTTSTSVWVAPTTSSTLATVASTTSSAAAATATASGSTYEGDITWYDVGLGSCGWTNTDDEAIVAIPHAMMNNPANPNNNPWCGKYITISYAGATHQAKIVDTCGGCDGNAIDLSPTLFTAVAPSGNGRVHDVEWWFT